jgi:hypothetical protein
MKKRGWRSRDEIRDYAGMTATADVDLALLTS